MLENKIALITGGHHSLGLAISKEFAKNNYDLIITYYQNQDAAIETKEKLEQEYNINVTIQKVDLSNIEDLQRFIENIKKYNIQINCLINNAALTIEEEFSNKKIEDFNKILTVNTIAPYYLAKELNTLMPDNSSIINIASTNGIDTYSPITLEYDASKSALISVTHNLALELGPNIRVNVIAPGWINTNSTKDMNPIYREQETNKIIVKRFAEPEEIAKVVYFVGSEDASYINNSVIRVDGGSYVTK